MASETQPEGGTDDPIAYFLQDIVLHGKSKRTQESYERVLRRFESFLSDPAQNPFQDSISPSEATHRHCMAWIHTLREELASSTIAVYAAYLHRFYAYMNQVGVFDDNPMTLVREEMDETIEKDPIRRDISISQMRDFVSTIHHPLHRATILMLLKTGIRVGELSNLDLRDIRLSDSPANEDYHLGERPELDGHDDSIFVSSEPTYGVQSNTETRKASNKRKRATIIPVDEELRRAVEKWLMIRPEALSTAEPLFLGTTEHWGTRLTPDGIRYIVNSHAKKRGWYNEGDSASANVTPHYFRHFFTTHLRDRTGDRGIVKYLRGDVASDIIDTYTHNWGEQVRETYLEHIYDLETT